MVDWLQTRFSKTTNSIVNAGVFGSVSAGSSMPNDCDLYIVSLAEPDSIQWYQLKKTIIKIREDFFSQFKISLNVILFTLEEWEEKKGFFHASLPLYYLKIV